MFLIYVRSTESAALYESTRPDSLHSEVSCRIFSIYDRYLQRPQPCLTPIAVGSVSEVDLQGDRLFRAAQAGAVRMTRNLRAPFPLVLNSDSENFGIELDFDSNGKTFGLSRS